MTCRNCLRIRKVFGIKRRVGVDGVNPDPGLFPDGLTLAKKFLHVGGALAVLAICLWVIWFFGRVVVLSVEWFSTIMVGTGV